MRHFSSFAIDIFDEPFIIHGFHTARYLLFYENETMNLLRCVIYHSELANKKHYRHKAITLSD